MASVRTPEGMLSFPHLFVAKAAVLGGDPRFSISLVFDAAAMATQEYKNLRAAVAEAINTKWGADKSQDAAFCGKLRLPFRDAAEKNYAGYEAGKKFIGAWTKTKPGLVDGNLHDINAQSDVWAGQTARATVTAFAYDQGGNRGVGFMLNNVQITKADGPRMDGRKNANQDFESVGGGAPADDESPF